MDSTCHRRLFFKKAAKIVATLVIAPLFVNAIGHTVSSEGQLAEGELTPFINQAFRFYCFKDGRVELSAVQKSGAKISHIYSPGLEVDILLLIAQNKPVNDNLKEIARRHSLSEPMCKNMADKMMNEFKSKEMICYGKSTIIRKTQALYS